MHYNGLSRGGKISFQGTLGNAMKRVFENVETDCLHMMLVDDDLTFAFIILEIELERALFQTWVEEGLVITPEELKDLAKEKEKRMRKKKPTEKQVTFFHDLAIQLNRDEQVPDDYLVFERQLQEMRKDAKKKRKPTEKQSAFFNDLAVELGESEEIPDDYLIFEQKLAEMIRKSKNKPRV